MGWKTRRIGPWKRRARSKNTYYARWMNYECANPECGNRGPHVHHIRLLSQGGQDEIWNLICLCAHCHNKLQNHSRPDERAPVLFTWKAFAESRRFGFVLDNQDADYEQNLLRVKQIYSMRSGSVRKTMQYTQEFSCSRAI